MSTVVQINHLSVTYPGKRESLEVIHDLSIELESGGIYCIIGPSGCGKSTLLKVLGGIIKDYAGEITINGRNPDPRFHSIGLVPQNYGLLPWKRVKENISLATRLRNIPVDKEYNEEIVRTLGLEDILSCFPGELSGGQQQRVALARSFIQKPDLLLMDEPFSALDTLTAEKCRNLFLEVWKKHKVTTLFVTHNLEEAVRLGKKIILFATLPGRIIQIIDNPLTEKGADRSDEFYFRETEKIKKLLNKAWG